jgi:hypothetical protein
MDSAFAELSRAKVHLDQLEADIRAFRAREPFDWPYSVSDHMLDESLAVVTFRVHVKEEMPNTWGLMIGDILSNLRATLDHAVYGHAAARADAAGTPLTNRQEKELNFPITTVAADWPNHRARLSPFMDAQVIGVIENWQPFNQQQVAADWHPLAVLNSLVNRDKHREVRVVSYVNELFDITASDHEVVDFTASPKEMAEGAIVAHMRIRRPLRRAGDTAALIRSNFSVVNGYTEIIEIPKVGQQRSVLPVMKDLVSNVETLLNELKAAGC